MKPDSIFTQIINGDIPSHKVYEDDTTLAFLDIHPVQLGHVLVIPKKQIATVWDLPVAEYTAVMATVQKVGIRLREVLGLRVAIRVVGEDMPDHAHVQLIPFADAKDLYHQPDPNAEPDHEALAIVAEKLRF